MSNEGFDRITNSVIGGQNVTPTSKRRFGIAVEGNQLLRRERPEAEHTQ
jgi:hypothetical protein